jgi:hypothetical protein
MGKALGIGVLEDHLVVVWRAEMDMTRILYFLSLSLSLLFPSSSYRDQVGKFGVGE